MKKKSTILANSTLNRNILIYSFIYSKTSTNVHTPNN
jgi:hypothetical protein